MKADITTKLYKSAGFKQDHKSVNKLVKAVIINFGDERGDIVVTNDNYGTRRKYADFTEGKRKAGLHRLQIVFGGLDFAKSSEDRFIDGEGNIRYFKDLK